MSIVVGCTEGCCTRGLVALPLASSASLSNALSAERFSFHPGRSTLLYSLAVTLAICWSGWRLVTDRLELLETRQRVSLNTRFTSVVSFGSMTGLCMTPLLWFEARHVRRHQPAAAELMVRAALVPQPRWDHP